MKGNKRIIEIQKYFTTFFYLPRWSHFILCSKISNTFYLLISQYCFIEYIYGDSNWRNTKRIFTFFKIPKISITKCLNKTIVI